MSFTLLGILNAQAAGAVVGATSFDLLETTILTADTASVSFTGLGDYSNYKHLQVRLVARSDRGFNNAELYANFNSDTTSSYASHSLTGTGSSVTSSSNTSASLIKLGNIFGSTEASGAFASTVIDILDFSSASKNTTIKAFNGFFQVKLNSGLYAKTDPITSVDLTQEGNNFVTGSRFSLYGIKTGA